MKTFAKIACFLLAVLPATSVLAQQSATNVSDELKLAAVEALISAPPERALPLAKKVLDGNNSIELKERALFILSQIDRQEAQQLLLQFATDASQTLQHEAIRMIGIGGDADSLSELRSIYDSGNNDTREAVLEALMIAGDEKAVYDIASTAEGDALDQAIDMLGAMGAREELRQLRDKNGASEALIEAYAISGDLEPLLEIAADSNAEHQTQAIEAMGMVGGTEVDAALIRIYKSASSEDVKEAALDGLLIAGNDAGLLELYRSSTDTAEKKKLLEMLVMMGSDSVWELIDSALDGGP